MARPRYRFNERTLRYEPAHRGFWSRFFASLPTFLGGCGIAACLTLVVLYYSGEPPFEYAHLKQENQRLLERYEKLNQKFQEVEKNLQTVQKRDDSLYRTLFGVEPIPQNVRRSGIGGVERYQHLRDEPRSKLLIKTHSKLDKIEQKLKVQKRSFNELMKKAEQKKRFLTHVPAIRPMREDRIDHIASGYGMRFHPIYRVLKMHSGIDFTADVGTPVHATGAGTVKRVEKDRSGYGHNVLVDHGHGYKSLYAHLSDFKVREGERVERGQVIGLSGNSGTSTGPHLHYEVIEKGKKVDPVDYFFSDLDPNEYQKVVKAAQRSERSL